MLEAFGLFTFILAIVAAIDWQSRQKCDRLVKTLEDRERLERLWEKHYGRGDRNGK